MKICTAVMTYDDPLYNHFDKIKRAYLEKNNEDYYFVYNGTDNSKNDLSKRSLNYYSDIHNEGGIPVIYLKFINLIQSGIFNNYDFIIRVNSSTFINMDIIREKLATLKDNIYMGFFDPAWHFVSGACIIFSQDMLQLLAKNFNTVNYFKEDDVVIGDIMTSQNVNKTYLDRYCLHNLTAVPSEEEIQKALTYPQIRIRNHLNNQGIYEGMGSKNRAIVDVGIWNKISNILQL